MTDFDIRLLLAVAAEAAGMIAIAWIYACYRYPGKSAGPRPRCAPVAIATEIAEAREKQNPS